MSKNEGDPIDYTGIYEGRGGPHKEIETTLSKTIQKLVKNFIINPNRKTWLDPTETHCAKAYDTP